MELKAGDHVEVESESTERQPRRGIIEEVVHGPPSPRYRIKWDDGHESIYTPSAGALSLTEQAKKRMSLSPSWKGSCDSRVPPLATAARSRSGSAVMVMTFPPRSRGAACP